MSTPPTLPPAAWHPDPDDANQWRWWDGQRWTDHRAPRQAPVAESVEVVEVAETKTTADVFTQPRFAVLDVETTGLAPSNHRIVEIAILTTDNQGGVLDEWTTRVNPQGPVGATHIHGITAADVADAPTFDQVADDVALRISGAAVCAHNASFDLAFLTAEYARIGWEMPSPPCFCTLEASTHYLPQLDRRRLSDCCWAIGSPLTDAHTALGDARATAQLLSAFMGSRDRSPRTQDRTLVARAARITWTTAGRPSTTSAAPEPQVQPEVVSTEPAALSGQALRNIAAQRSAQPSETLVQLVERFSLRDALDEGAPEGAIAYMEKLAEVLEDGILTIDEAAALSEVAAIQQLDGKQLEATHRAFILALANAALADGKVSSAEKSELTSVAHLLGVNQKEVPALVELARGSMLEQLGAGLAPLPDWWTYGDPLRVGDMVTFTGCDPNIREGLEAETQRVGARVTNYVAATTAMLVTDGSMQGTKLAKARKVGTRIVDPGTYVVLLQYIQPALTREPNTPAPRHARPQAAERQRAREVAPDLEGVSPATVRAWARENGWEVGVRGRLPLPLLDAYAAAHPASVNP